MKNKKLFSIKGSRKLKELVKNEENEVVSEEVLTRLFKGEKYNEKNYSILFEKDEKIAKIESLTATEDEVASQVKILIGSEWETKDNEVIIFQKKMKDIWFQNFIKYDLGKYEDNIETVILPKYVSSDTIVGEKKSMKFLCGVHIDKGEQFNSPIFKAIDCDVNKTANSFLADIIERANTYRVKTSDELVQEDWVLKVTGSNEYIYGEEELYTFESIQKALKYGKPYIELNLMHKLTKKKNFDTYWQKLSKVDYCIDREFLSLKPIDNDKITNTRKENKPEDLPYMSIRDFNNPFSILIKQFAFVVDPKGLITSHLHFTKKGKLKNGEKTFSFDSGMYFVHVEAVHGSYKLGEGFTQALPFSDVITWGQNLEFYVDMKSGFEKILVSDIPREAVLLMTVFARKKNSKDPMTKCTNGYGEVKDGDIPIGGVRVNCVDFKGYLRQGPEIFRLNPGMKANLWTCGEGIENFILTFFFPQFEKPVVYPTLGSISMRDKKRLQVHENKMKYKYSIFKGKKLHNEVAKIKELTPLNELTERQKWILWKSKAFLVNDGELLPKFLLSVPWHLQAAVRIAHRYLSLWTKPIDPLTCLEMLDYKFADQKVRMCAVKELNKLESNELSLYILQLTQALRFELYHDSSLARFLLQRALSDQDIAQSFFWNLKSEMYIKSIRTRFGMLLQEFLKRCGGFRIELLKQNCVLEQLYKIALLIKQNKGTIKKREAFHEKLREQLKRMKLPKKFKLPHNSKIELCGIVYNRCKVMTSAKLPLFLFFENSDIFEKEDFGILYKVGDDIKQDVLCLQMLKVMDQLWKKHDMDFHIRAYDAISTGELTGMVELVQRSETIADIAYSKGVKKMLKKDVILQWLKSKNPKTDWEFMKENFMFSAAGYCVATYILGLGDRHNDNIMLSEKGELFHIDFGHFLNHRKKFLGVKRETTPFVFPPNYASVLGGSGSKLFKRFQNYSSNAFKILRKKRNLIIVLLMLMMGSGLEEMSSEEDIRWVEDSMVLEKGEKDSEKFWFYLIKLAMKNQRQVINDVWHITWHKIIQK